jgi:hypothetical protein
LDNPSETEVNLDALLLTITGNFVAQPRWMTQFHNELVQTMTWRELSDFLNLQRLSISPRPLHGFARNNEGTSDKFKRIEKATRDDLNNAVEQFAVTEKWSSLSEEQILMLYFRLSYAIDLAMALSTNKTGLFPTLEGHRPEMIRWSLNEVWEYPGLPHTLRLSFEKSSPLRGRLLLN